MKYNVMYSTLIHVGLVLVHGSGRKDLELPWLILDSGDGKCMNTDTISQPENLRKNSHKVIGNSIPSTIWAHYSPLRHPLSQTSGCTISRVSMNPLSGPVARMVESITWRSAG